MSDLSSISHHLFVAAARANESVVAKKGEAVPVPAPPLPEAQVIPLELLGAAEPLPAAAPLRTIDYPGPGKN